MKRRAEAEASSVLVKTAVNVHDPDSCDRSTLTASDSITCCTGEKPWQVLSFPPPQLCCLILLFSHHGLEPATHFSRRFIRLGDFCVTNSEPKNKPPCCFGENPQRGCWVNSRLGRETNANNLPGKRVRVPGRTAVVRGRGGLMGSPPVCVCVPEGSV